MIQRKIMCVLVCLAVLSASRGFGAVKTWDGSTGNWSNDAKWVSSGQPTASDNAYVVGGSIAITEDGEVCALLHLTNGTVEMSSGTLDTSQQLRMGHTGNLATWT
jgi:hypothetical protein